MDFLCSHGWFNSSGHNVSNFQDNKESVRGEQHGPFNVIVHRQQQLNELPVSRGQAALSCSLNKDSECVKEATLHQAPLD